MMDGNISEWPSTLSKTAWQNLAKRQMSKQHSSTCTEKLQKLHNRTYELLQMKPWSRTPGRPHNHIIIPTPQYIKICENDTPTYPLKENVL